MAGRPPQGRGSGGRVTPSAKRPTAAAPARSRKKATATTPGTKAGKPTGSTGPSASAVATHDAPPASFAGRMKQLLVPPQAEPVERVRPWWGSGDVAIWFILSQVALYLGWILAVNQGGYDAFWPSGPGAVVGEVVGRTGAGQAASVTKTAADMPLWLAQGVAMIPAWAVFIGGPVVVAWRKGFGIVKDFRLSLRPIDVPLGLVVGALAQLVWVPASMWVVFRFTGEQDVSARARDLTERATSPTALVVLFVGVALLSPIAEEIFFRGLAFHAFSKRLGLVGGIVTSSVFFALIHPETIALPAYVGFAAMLAYLVHRFDRLGPAIAAHVGFNLVTAVTLVLGA